MLEVLVPVPRSAIEFVTLGLEDGSLTSLSVNSFWYPSFPSVFVTAARMMFFSVVFRLGVSPDSSTTTPPSPVVVN
jgi:hypothetical protein